MAALVVSATAVELALAKDSVTIEVRNPLLGASADIVSTVAVSVVLSSVAVVSSATELDKAEVPEIAVVETTRLGNSVVAGAAEVTSLDGTKDRDGSDASAVVDDVGIKGISSLVGVTRPVASSTADEARPGIGIRDNDVSAVVAASEVALVVSSATTAPPAIAVGTATGGISLVSPGSGTNGPASSVCSPGSGRSSVVAASEAVEVVRDPKDCMLSELLAETSDTDVVLGAILTLIAEVEIGTAEVSLLTPTSAPEL